MSRRRKRKPKPLFVRLQKSVGRAVRNVSRRRKRLVKRASRAVSRSVKRTETKVARAIRKTAKGTLKTARRTARQAKRTTKTLVRQGGRVTRRGIKAGRRNAKWAVRRLRVNSRKAPRVIRKKLKTLQRAYKKRQQARLTARTRMRIMEDVQFESIRGAQATQSGTDTGGSRPGEPPKMRTGKGRSSISAELRRKGKYKLESRVFVDKKIAPYMALWEFRPDKKQRPFLKPSVQENLELLGRVIGQRLQELATASPRRKAKVN